MFASGFGHRVGFRDQQRSPLEVTAQGHRLPQHVDADGQHLQRAARAGKLDATVGDRQARVVVPQVHRRGGRQPSPSQQLVRGHIVRGEQRDCPLQHRCCNRASLREHLGEPVQEEIAGTRRVRRRHSSAGGARDIRQAALTRQPPGEQRRAPCIEIRVASQGRVERLQPPGRAQQQRRRIAAAVVRKGHLGVQQIHAGASELIHGTRLRGGQQAERRLERAGPQVRVRRGEHALGAARRIDGEVC